MYLILYISDVAVTLRHTPSEKIHFIRLLGEGAFARVYLGTCEGLTPGEHLTMVAIKTLKARSHTKRS